MFMKPNLKRSRRSAPAFPPAGALSEYLAGLRKDPKRLASKFFYDDEGNRLFDRICSLEEYYPTRSEFQILRENVEEIGALIGEDAALVELGSGTGDKGRMLLNHLWNPAAYIPVEIGREQLERSVDETLIAFPELTIKPVCTDYTQNLRLPSLPSNVRRMVLFFPGSTIGNFEPIEAIGFLLKLVRLGGKKAGLLIGIDLKKEAGMLEAAYNDPHGVTAAFNRNILARANRDWGANFQVDAFRHQAFYDQSQSRIVMQLVSQCEQEVSIGSERIAFASEERVTTEYSYKYTIGEFQALARLARFSPRAVWTDPEKLFSLHYLTVEG